MDDKNKGYRGGLYGTPEQSDDFMPYMSEPTLDTTSETFHDPLFEEKPAPPADGKFSLMSIIFGGIAVLAVCIWQAALLCGVLGLACGIIGKIQNKKDADNKWKTWAGIGIVLSIIALAIIGVSQLMIHLGIWGQESYGSYLSGVEQSLNQ